MIRRSVRLSLPLAHEADAGDVIVLGVLFHEGGNVLHEVVAGGLMEPWRVASFAVILTVGDGDGERNLVRDFGGGDAVVFIDDH